MSDIGYRKKGDTGPLYSPERDYAYITPTLMVTAIENMDSQAAGPEALAWRSSCGVTAEDVVKVAEAVADAQREFVNAADPVHSLEQALARHGFYDLRYPVRQLLFAAVGEVFLGAWFKAVREVSLVGEESPASTDMARFSATVREFVRREGGLTYNADHRAEHLKFYTDVLQGRINVLYKEVQRLTSELTAAKNEISALTAAKPARQSALARISALFKKGS